MGRATHAHEPVTAQRIVHASDASMAKYGG